MVCSSTICTKFNVQIGAGRHLKGFGQASLSGARSSYMPPRLKTNKTNCRKRDALLRRRRNRFIGDALLNVITLFNQGNGDIADGQVHCHPTKMLSSQALRILTDDPVRRRAATASVSVRHIMLRKRQKCSKTLVLCP